MALLFIRTPLPAPPRPEIKRGLWTEIVEGIRFLTSRPLFRAVLAFATLVNFAAGAFFTTLTMKLLQAGVHPAAIGSVDAIGAVAGIIGAVFAPRLMRKFATGPLVIAWALLVTATIAMAFTNNVPSPTMSLHQQCLRDRGTDGARDERSPGVQCGALRLSDQRHARRVVGAGNADLACVATVAQPAGPIVGGTQLALLGGRSAMLAMAVLMAMAVIPLALNRDVRAMSTPDTWPSADDQTAVAEELVSDSLAAPGGSPRDD